MERVYHMQRTSPTEYVFGRCNLCHQKNVTVTSFSCGQHARCRVCVQFLPHLKESNVPCPVCIRHRNADSQQKLEHFINQHTGHCHTPLQATTKEHHGNEIFSFSDPEDDLSGNNTVWEHLLQPADPVSAPCSSKLQGQPHGSVPQLETEPVKKIGTPECMKPLPRLIPHKSSVINLMLPSTRAKYIDPKCLNRSKQPISNTVTGLLQDTDATILHSSENEGSRSSSGGSDVSYPSSRSSLLPQGAPGQPEEHRSHSGDSFTADPTELERGTSPFKALRIRKMPGKFESRSEAASDEDPEVEYIKDEIGIIEGPGCDSPLSSTLWRGLENDDFWDV